MNVVREKLRKMSREVNPSPSNEESLERILRDHMPVPSALVDRKLKVVFTCKRLTDMLNLPDPDELIGKDLPKDKGFSSIYIAAEQMLKKYEGPVYGESLDKDNKAIYWEIDFLDKDRDRLFINIRY